MLPFSSWLHLPQDVRHLTVLFLAASSAWATPSPSSNSTPFQDNFEYDAKELEGGSFPLLQLVSAPYLYAPRVNVIQESSLCSTRNQKDREYTFIAPRGAAANATPIILDDSGELVWAGGTDRGLIYDLKVQRFQGEDVITYWTGDDMVKGHGSGEFHILDSAYNEIRTVQAGNGFEADLHDFVILDSNTALMTIYTVINYNFESVDGPADGEMWESVFQELDLGTGDVLFEWRALDHYTLDDTYRTRSDPIMGTIGEAFDWFHINSVDKDAQGNYLISARYTHSLTYIDGRTGETIWILGGKRNMFKDLSKGKATTFAGQHDARFMENGTVITLFDNGEDYDTHDAPYSRGVRIHIDTVAMTAKLLIEYMSPEGILAESQGSMQTLTNGNVLIGYGFVPVYTEFAPDGRVLCNVHFAAGLSFPFGEVMSYRTFKQPWRAFPQTRPDAALLDGEVYVSWNGATEVRNWVVKAGHDPEGVAFYEELARGHHTGFETRIPLDRTSVRGRWARVLGLGDGDAVLGASDLIDLGEPPELPPGMLEPKWWSGVGDALTGRNGTSLGPVCLVVIAVVAGYGLFRWRKVRVARAKGYALIAGDGA